MTVLHGIELDDVYVERNEIQDAIENNDPIEENLHVIMVISNPCQYVSRFVLAKQFAQRIERTCNVTLYTVELAYGSDKFYMTEATNPRHLQVRGEIPIWHKENMVNMGIRHLLPTNWKAVAWIDADVEFENPSWALDTLRILNGTKDVVQIFSHSIDMDVQEDAMSIFPSFGYQYTKKRQYGRTGINMWHPGYAWACTRRAYEKMGGLYELSALGAGDHNMAFAFIRNVTKSVNALTTEDYKQSLRDFERRAAGLRLGYVPGLIRHFFHGTKVNRKYAERWKILVDNAFAPTQHLKKREDGLLIPTELCPAGLLEDIMLYFHARNEDEGIADALRSGKVNNITQFRA